jgi:hypothetical protein
MRRILVMPTSGPIKDLAAAMARLDESIAAITTWQEGQLSRLKAEVARAELSSMRTQVEILKSQIETHTTLAQARDEDPRVEDLVKRVTAKLDEFDRLKTKYQLEFPPPRRWWRFWP